MSITTTSGRILKTGVTRLSGGVSRSDRKTTRTLGIIPGKDAGKARRVRDEKLDLYDKYYSSEQYKDLIPWDQALEKEDHVPIRKRQPRIMLNFAKMLSARVSTKLIGDNVFPTFTVEDDPDTQEFIRILIKAVNLKHSLADPMRKMINTGSIFVRYFVAGGAIKIEGHLAKHCYPEFQENGELRNVRVQYVFSDRNDLDESGKPREKWFRMDLSMFSDTLYDTPLFKPDVEPVFMVTEEVTHDLGFVQGEWFKTGELPNVPDGPAIIQDILGFIDELNYSISQTSQAIGYNQDPQLTFNKMDEDEIDTLIRSAAKSWNLGREGSAEFLEAGLSGAAMAMDFRDKLRTNIQDIARVVLLDPEKIVGHAQSAKAMEILHGPLVEYINELRPLIEQRVISLLQKMALTVLVGAKQSMPLPITIPPGFMPKSLNIAIAWPPIFPLTISDLTERVNWVSAATGANLIARETGTRVLAKDFGIEDIDEEIAKINAQPVLNPFGAF